MWESPTIARYTCQQLAIFFFYHTSAHTHISGVVKFHPEDCRRFLLPDGSPMSKEQFIQNICDMPENFYLDLDNSLLLCKQFFEHNGLARGNPKLVFKSISARMRQTAAQGLNVWEEFCNLYPAFQETWNSARTFLEKFSPPQNSDSPQSSRFQSLAKSEDPLYKVYANFRPNFDKLFKNLIKVLLCLTKYNKIKLNKIIINNTSLTGINPTTKYVTLSDEVKGEMQEGETFDRLFAAFQDHLASRLQSSTKPLTEQIVNSLSEKIISLADDHSLDELIEIINTSTRRGYSDFFPLADDSRKKIKSKKLEKQSQETGVPKSSIEETPKNRAMIERAIAKSALAGQETLESVVQKFQDLCHPDTVGDYTLDKILTNRKRAREVVLWLRDNHSHEKHERIQILKNAGLPADVEHLFAIEMKFKTLSNQELRECLASSDTKPGSIDELLDLIKTFLDQKNLEQNADPEPEIQPEEQKTRKSRDTGQKTNPMVELAKTRALTRSEYDKIPPQLKELFKTDDWKSFFLK
jgi:hypothetical protein